MIRRLALAALAALALFPAAASAQVITSTPPSCAKAGANTVTASAPVLDCTQTWNNAGITFYGFRLNVTDTASAAGSLLMDLQKAGVSQFNVDKSGNVTATGQLVVATGIQNGGASQTGWGGRSQLSSPADGNLKLANNAGTSFGLLQLGGTTASFPALKRSGTGIQVRLADDSGYADIVGNNMTAASLVFTGIFTVAGLPTCNAGTKAGRAFVTDANATTFLSTVAAGGANNVPVVCDGTNWKIG